MSYTRNICLGVASIMLTIIIVVSMVTYHARGAQSGSQSFCEQMRTRAFDDCSDSLMTSWSDEGGDIYSRQQRLIDRRVCLKVSDAVYATCKNPKGD